MKDTVAQKSACGKREIAEVKEEFTGRNLTRFGGSGLIRGFFHGLKIRQRLDHRVLVEGRRKSKYSVGTVLMSCLYGMFLGYSRPYQMKVLCGDKVFQKLVGLCGFPSQSTISRFLSSVRVSVARQIGSFNFDFVLNRREGFKAFETITLDLDSHVTTVYGNPQRAAVGYNPKKKGRKSYHSLMCFVGETRDYIGGKLRSGKHHSSYKAVEFIKELDKKLPSHIQQIRLRADSGFFSHDLIKYLAKRSIEFIIVVPMQPWVQRKIRHMAQWKSLGWGLAVGEYPYVVKKDLTLRMVVVRQRVKAQAVPKKQLKLLNTEEITYDYQVLVSNSEEDPETVWRTYNQRACCENFIKEGIYGLGLDKVVSHSYGGNSTWFELLMLGYNLMNLFKEEVLNQKKTKAMVSTIRDALFLIPAKLIRSSRRWILKLEGTWPYREEFMKARCRVT